MSAGLTPVLEGYSICRINSSPGGPQCLHFKLQSWRDAVSAGLTLVQEGRTVSAF